MSFDPITLALAKPKVIDLGTIGLQIMQKAFEGGGSVDIDASDIFSKIKRGENYIFRTAYGGSGEQTLYFPAVFYRYNWEGNFEDFGVCIKGNMGSNIVQVDVVISIDYANIVVTPLGA